MICKIENGLQMVISALRSRTILLGRSRRMYLLVLYALLIGSVRPGALVGAEQTAFPDWLEPRGLHIVELVGQVPEDILRDTIISYGDAVGLVVYQSGTRDGNRVVLTTTIYPRVRSVAWAGILTEFGCLGQNPFYDHMGSVAPASTLRIYDASGNDVTQRIQFMYLTDMGTRQPLAGSTAYIRYPVKNYGDAQGYSPLPMVQDGLHIPSNAGCRIEIPGRDLYPLTGIFTLDMPPATHARVVGMQDAKSQSYIGAGGVGIFAPLMAQMRSRYPDRHTRIPMELPDGADFLLLKFPPMPGDAYKDDEAPYPNADRPTGGTYRLSTDPNTLGTDLTFSAALPLPLAWRDADQAGGSTFLPTIPDPYTLAAPEYVIPAGIPYNSCFVLGGCSDSLLQQIYEKEMDLKLVYLSVATLANEGQWVPLQIAGPAWRPLTAASDAPASALASAETLPDQPWQIFLPMIVRPENLPPVPPPPDGTCPYGWFDSSGRMLDFSEGR